MAIRKLVGLASILLTAWALPASATPIRETVALGSDYFQTQPGTSFNFGGSIGTVNFLGVPFGPGSTDTIVQRQADALINGPAIPIQITALQLESTAPVTVGLYTGPIFVSLDPTKLALDTGTMSIAGGLGGGTFSSAFNLDFDVCTAVGVAGAGCGAGSELVALSTTLSNAGSAWSPVPSPGEVLVGGPFGDQAANLHTGLPCNVDECEVDFFTGTVTELHPGGGGQHVVDPAPAPEPGALPLLGPALLGLAGLRYRRRR